MAIKVKITCKSDPLSSKEEVLKDLDALINALKDKYPLGVEVEIEVPHLQLG